MKKTLGWRASLHLTVLCGIICQVAALTRLGHNAVWRKHAPGDPSKSLVLSDTKMMVNFPTGAAKVVGWEVFIIQPNPVYLMLWRQNHDAFVLVNLTYFLPTTTGYHRVTLDRTSQYPVKNGDTLGLLWYKGPAVAYETTDCQGIGVLREFFDPPSTAAITPGSMWYIYPRFDLTCRKYSYSALLEPGIDLRSYPFTLDFTRFAAVPPGSVNFTLKLEGTVMPVGLECAFRFQDGEDVFITIKTRERRISYRFVDPIQNEYSNRPTVVNCWNEYSSREFLAFIVFQYLLEDISLAALEVWKTKQIINLQIGCTSGSDVKYEIFFGDGNFMNKTSFGKDCSKGMNNITHSYMSPGTYNLTLHMSNDVSSKSLYKIIKIQNPVRNLELSMKHEVVSTSDTAHFKLEHKGNVENRPSHVSIELIYYYNMYTENTPFAYENLTEIPLLSEHLWSRSFRKVGLYSLKVICENLLGNETLWTDFEVQEPISGSRLEVNDEMLESAGTVLLQNKVHYSLSITIISGDPILYFINITGPGQYSEETKSLHNMSYSFDMPGVYLVRVLAFNRVSQESVIFNLMVQERIKTLKIDRLPALISPQDEVSLTASVTQGSHISWNVESNRTIFILNQTSNGAEVSFLLRLPVEGVHSICVTAANELGYENVCEGQVKVGYLLDNMSVVFSNSNGVSGANISVLTVDGTDVPVHNITIIVDFDDGFSVTELVNSYGTYEIFHIYNRPGWYSVHIVLHNAVIRRQEIHALAIYETILISEFKVISDQSVTASGSGDVYVSTSQRVKFHLLLSAGTNMSVTFCFGDGECQPSFHSNEKLIELTYEYLNTGSYHVTARLENPVSRVLLNQKIVSQVPVIVKTISIPTVGYGYTNITSGIELKAVPTDACYTMTTSDSAVVQTLNTSTCNITSNMKKMVNHAMPNDLTQVEFTHMFTVVGTYQITIIMKNKVSFLNITREIKIISICPPPSIKLRTNGMERETTKVDIGTCVRIDTVTKLVCPVASGLLYQWAVTSPGMDRSQLSEFLSKSYIEFRENTLEPGTHIVNLTVRAFPLENVFSSALTRIDITQPMIKVVLMGGADRALSVYQPLIIEAIVSPVLADYPIRSLKYLWSCKTIAGMFKGLPLIGNSAMPGCPREASQERSGGGSILSIPSTALVAGGHYVIKLIVEGPGQNVPIEQEVKVVTGHVLELSMTCLANCRSKKSPSKPLVVKAACTRCEEMAIMWSWRLYYFVSNILTEVNLRNLTSGDLDSSVVSLNLELLNTSVEYNLEVKATGNDASGTFRDTIRTNAPPSGGTCKITPEKGVALIDEYQVLCTNWVDEGSRLNQEEPGCNGPITYSVAFRQHGDVKAKVLYVGRNETSNQFILPPGKKENQQMLYIIITITDEFGDSANIETVVEVKLGDRDVMAAMVNKQTAKMLKSMADGDMSSCISTVYAVLPVLELTGNGKQIRGQIVGGVKENYKPMDTSQGVLMVSGAVTETVRETNQISEKTKADGSMSFASMAENIAELSDATLETIEETLTDMVGITSELLFNRPPVAVLDNSSETRINGATISSGFDQTLMHLSGAALSKMNWPEDAVTFNNRYITVSMWKPHKDNIQNTAEVNGVKVKVELGPDEQETGLQVLKVAVMPNNPYWWSEGPNPNSQVINVANFPEESVTTSTGRRRRRQAKSSVEISTKAKSKRTWSMFCYDWTDTYRLSYHKVNLTRIAGLLSVVLQFSGQLGRITVFWRHDDLPTPNAHNGTKSWTHCTGASTCRVNVSIDFSEPHNETLFIGIGLELHNESITSGIAASGNRIQKQTFAPCVSNHTEMRDQTGAERVYYKISVQEVTCIMWDRYHRRWQENPRYCKISPEPSGDTYRIKSNLFGSFAVGLFTPPNTIDFSRVFLNIEAKLRDNAHVLGTLGGILALYLLTLPLLRYVDRKEMDTWAFRSLIDNRPEANFRYKISVFTRTGKGSGTDSNVYFILRGEEGCTSSRFLTDGFRKHFSPGKIDNFLLRTETALGSLSSLHVWHDGSGVKSSWYLYKVVVHDLQTHNGYTFLCDQWLASDGRCDVILQPASDQDLRNVGKTLPVRTKISLFDDHLWLSVAFRPQVSVFNRVQRLSCCLALLFLSMVSNAMWFTTDNKGVPVSMVRVGPLEFTIHEIYVSSMTCLTVFPATLLIIAIFRYASREGACSGCCKRRNGRNFVLPSWCLYLGWILVFLSVSVSAFFTVLYSFEWGGQKSVGWLVSMAISTLESVFIVNPVKVLVVVVITACILRRPIRQDNLTELPVYEDDTETLLTKAHWPPVPRPPSETPHTQTGGAAVERAKLERKTEKKVYGLVTRITCHVIYLGILLLLVGSSVDNEIFLQNMTVRKVLLGDVHKVKTKHDFWAWLKTTSLDTLYLSTWYNGKPYTALSGRAVLLQEVMRLGPPRLRQIRTTRDGCQERSSFSEQQKIRCSSHMAYVTGDTESYDPYWSTQTNTTNRSHRIDVTMDTADAFKYKNEYCLLHWGVHHFYCGGGYIMKLSDQKNISLQIVDQLQELEWIDPFTRVVYFEFNLFNMNTNLFVFVRATVEFPAFGSASTTVYVNSARLYDYSGPSALLFLIGQGIFLIAVLVLTVRTVYQACRLRGKFFRKTWKVFDTVVLTFSYSAIGVYTFRTLKTIEIVEKLMNNRDTFVSLEEVIVAGECFTTLFAMVLFLTTLQFLQLLKFNRNMWLVPYTLKHASRTMKGMVAIFFVLYLTFVQSGCLMFSMISREFQHQWASFVYLGTVVLRRFKMEESELSEGGVWMLVYFLTFYVIIVYTMTSLIVSLVTEAAIFARKDIHRRKNEADVLEFIWTLIQEIFIPAPRSSDKYVATEDQKSKQNGKANTIGSHKDHVTPEWPWTNSLRFGQGLALNSIKLDFKGKLGD